MKRLFSLIAQATDTPLIHGTFLVLTGPLNQATFKHANFVDTTAKSGRRP